MLSARQNWAALFILSAMPLLLGTTSCSEPAPSPPNVLLITLDTCRADHLALYGSERNTMPALEDFAKECVVFSSAFSNSSFTPPSHASLMTSRYPAEHGLRYWNRRLAEVPTAASLFASQGYRTGAFSPLPTLFIIGLDRGFQTTAGPEPDIEHPVYPLGDGEAVNRHALPWLTEEDDRPFFAWVHYYDAHRIYGRQGAEYRDRFSDFEDKNVGGTEDWYRLTPDKRQRLGITKEQARYLEDRYDGGLSYLDEQVAFLLDDLRSKGILEETIVVITADHGEVMDEYDGEWFSHDPWLVDENIHVPLLLRLPHGAHRGLQIDALVEGVDILPTLLSLSGLQVGVQDFSGNDLSSLLSGKPSMRSYVFADRMGDDRPKADISDKQRRRSRDRTAMIRSSTHKYIRYLDRAPGSDEALWAIGQEGRDIRQTNPRLLDDMRKAFSDKIRAMETSDTEGQSLDQDLESLLRQLGYVGDDG
ncbi:MAG: sulfatase [Planctomycetota bacterium]|nr:sulfatase [Planctomycetota bacterium]